MKATNASGYYYESYLIKGNNYLNQGKYDNAIENYKKVPSVNPNFNYARQYIAIAYYNKGIVALNNKQYEIAINNFKQSLAIRHNSSNSKKTLTTNFQNDSNYSNLALSYAKLNKYELSIINYKKALQIQPNSTQYLHGLAEVFLAKGDYESAMPIYQKLLHLDSSDHVANNNLQFISSKIDDKIFSFKLNSLIQSTPSQTAPANVYKLVVKDPSIDIFTLSKCYRLLDILWSDHESRNLLTVLAQKNIPINIRNINRAYARNQTTDYNSTIALWGLIPLYTYKVKSEHEITVNIGSQYILKFYDQTLPSESRMDSLIIFVHEFCHAVNFSFNLKSEDSIQEELIATMIGRNVVSRTIKGHEITQSEVLDYSKLSLKSILNDDTYRKMSIYNDFISTIQKAGVNPPHPEYYSNMANLYSLIRNDEKLRRLDSLEKLIYVNNN